MSDTTIDETIETEPAGPINERIYVRTKTGRLRVVNHQARHDDEAAAAARANAIGDGTEITEDEFLLVMDGDPILHSIFPQGIPER